MTLKEMPKVGEKVRFKGQGDTAYHDGVSVGTIYEISEIKEHGACFTDDRASEDCGSYISEEYFECFELVVEPAEGKPVEASPTVIELLANISRRLYEAERKIDSQRNQIDVLNSVVSRL